MTITLTSKGQITIPKYIRNALGLDTGSQIDFVLNEAGEVVLRKAGPLAQGQRIYDRFEAVRGTATIKWDTDELMALMRGEDD